MCVCMYTYISMYICIKTHIKVCMCTLIFTLYQYTYKHNCKHCNLNVSEYEITEKVSCQLFHLYIMPRCYSFKCAPGFQ